MVKFQRFNTFVAKIPEFTLINFDNDWSPARTSHMHVIYLCQTRLHLKLGEQHTILAWGHSSDILGKVPGEADHDSQVRVFPPTALDESPQHVLKKGNPQVFIHHP